MALPRIFQLRGPHQLAQFFRIIRSEPAEFFPLLVSITSFLVRKYVWQQKTLKKKIHGFYLDLPLDDPGISRSLLLIGDREREHRYILERTVRPGDVILEIGANAGYYALMEAKLLCGHGRVIALEPSPANYSRLLANLRLNPELSRLIKPFPAAVADRDGSSDLHLSRLSNVHSLVPEQVPSPTHSSLKVRTLSLATVCSRFGTPGYIRMDIEGYEQAILQSLITLNDQIRFLPSLLFELHPPNYDRDLFIATLNQLYGLGYRARYLATSHSELLFDYGIKLETSVVTDGTVRHICADVDLEPLKTLAFSSRAILLETKK